MQKKNVSFKGNGRAKAIAIKDESTVSPLQTKPPKEKNSAKPIFKPVSNIKEPKEEVVKDKAMYQKATFERLFMSLKSDYKLSSYSAYYCVGVQLQYIAGEQIEEIALEQYLSLPATSVFINPNGIFDDRRYLSRYVTRIYENNGMYIICLSSYSLEAFNNANALTLEICDNFGKTLLIGGN